MHSTSHNTCPRPTIPIHVPQYLSTSHKYLSTSHNTCPRPTNVIPEIFPPLLSFPSSFIGNPFSQIHPPWIPACAGMTVSVCRLGRAQRNPTSWFYKVSSVYRIHGKSCSPSTPYIKLLLSSSPLISSPIYCSYFFHLATDCW